MLSARCTDSLSVSTCLRCLTHLRSARAENVSACSLHSRCKSQTLILCAGLAGKGDFNELMSYSTQAGYKPDYLYLMQRLMMDNPEAAVNLAKMIAKQPGPPMDLNTLADLFLQRNAVREATAFLLDVLQENKPEQDKLQTKVSWCSSSAPVWCSLAHKAHTLLQEQ